MSDGFLIIIGAGTEQEKVYKVAQEMGLNIVATDINPEAHCLQFCDKYVQVSTRDHSKTLKALIDAKVTNPIGVITLANDVPLTVATVAKYYGLPSMTIETAMNFASKIRMKHKFENADVPTARYKVVESYSEACKFMETLQVPSYILKPDDGRGSLGVRYFCQNDFSENLFDEVYQIASQKAIIIEEFIDGIQISSESYLKDGGLVTPALAERDYSKLNDTQPIVLEDGGTIPAKLTKKMVKEIDRIILLAANSLGLKEGTIKGDLVVRDSHVYVIEMAGRLSGGWFASDQIPAATGVDLIKAQLLFCLGLKFDLETLRPNKNLSTTIKYIWPPFGRIKSIHGLKEVQKDPRCIKSGLFFSENDIYQKKEKHGDRFGYVITIGENYEQSYKAALEIVSRIEVNFYD